MDCAVSRAYDQRSSHGCGENDTVTRNRVFQLDEKLPRLMSWRPVEISLFFFFSFFFTFGDESRASDVRFFTSIRERRVGIL